MIAFTDSSNTPLLGEANYHLKLPRQYPGPNFWSVTLYEAENASGLANGQAFPSLGPRDKPVQNADGSTDLCLGPKAPDGLCDAVWRAEHGRCRLPGGDLKSPRSIAALT